MAKSKSPRKNSTNNHSPPPSSNKNSTSSAKSTSNGIGTTSAALQAATLNTPLSSPNQANHAKSDNIEPSGLLKETKVKVMGAINDVKDVMQLAANEFETVVENKKFTRMESPAEAAAVNAAKSEAEAEKMTATSGSEFSTGVSRTGGAETRGRRSSGLGPSALSYLSSNLFDSLRPDRKDADNKDEGNESDSSESSSDGSEMEYSSSSNSESSNSSHSTEDEASEEEDDYEEEEEEEEDEKAAENRASNGYKAAKKKKQQKQRQALKQQQQQQQQQRQQQLATNGSPRLKKKLQSKQALRIQQVQQQQQEQQQQAQPRSPTRASPLPPSPRDRHRHHHHDHDKPSDKEVVLLAAESSNAKWANWSVRTLWTLIMIGGFFACVAAGPLFVILLVVMVQALVYKEVIYLANIPSKEKRLPWFRTMNWYFLFSTNYFFYGESLIHYFQHVVFVDAFLLPFATHHRFISFTLYVIGFVFFVANLKKGHYRFQFSQFAWTHMTLLLVVCQSHFIINNIFEGLIWFFLPVSLVITNDIFAYIFGFFWGKTPLIKLSPKKTVEGFVGGWVMTIVFGIMFATLFLRYPYMICPVKDLRATAFSGLTCEPNPVFVPVKYYLKPWMVALVRHVGMRNHYVMIAPLQLHTIVMACFASLIAPFGGFFASGFKRAFKIKDFGQSIPGHGGITDRMDCQFLMGLFSYMYYQSFIKTTALSVGVVLQSAVNNLQGQEQLELFDHMRQYLIGQGLLDEDSCVIIPPKEAWIS